MWLPGTAPEVQCGPMAYGGQDPLLLPPGYKLYFSNESTLRSQEPAYFTHTPSRSNFY